MRRLLVLLVLLMAGCASSPPPDPGVRACGEVVAGKAPDRAVGALAAGSGESAVALSGARLRDAATADEVEAASAQLARVCRAWLAR